MNGPFSAISKRDTSGQFRSPKRTSKWIVSMFEIVLSVTRWGHKLHQTYQCHLYRLFRLTAGTTQCVIMQHFFHTEHVLVLSIPTVRTHCRKISLSSDPLCFLHQTCTSAIYTDCSASLLMCVVIHHRYTSVTGTCLVWKTEFFRQWVRTISIVVPAQVRCGKHAGSQRTEILQHWVRTIGIGTTSTCLVPKTCSITVR